MVYLRDGADILAKPITKLFNKIYETKLIPEQWKIGKITPIPKKGSSKDITNYRPITSLCSLAKVFERCILSRLMELGDITGGNQHGFKAGHSTTTALLQLQQNISESLDRGEYYGLVSLDLSAAFDMVDHDLLIKRMNLAGIPNDVIKLIENWLSNRSAYVEIGGESSMMFKVPEGTVQGSVLGPVLFAIFIAPMFEFTGTTSFADDSYIGNNDGNVHELIRKLQTETNTLTKWFKSSGLVVNESKTEFCLFHKVQKPKGEFILNDVIVKSTNNIKALGITLDSNLNWELHISNVSKSLNKLNMGFRSMKKYLNQEELLKLATSFYYSKMYYAACVWLIPTLTTKLWRVLMTSSSSVLKSITGIRCDENDRISYLELHKITKRATPIMMMKYVQATTLHRISSSGIPNNVYVDLITHHIENRRHYRPNFIKSNLTRAGGNIFRNRIQHMCNELSSDLTEQSYDQLKITAKRDFLTFRD